MMGMTVDVDTDTRRLCSRLYRERNNPPGLRKNLDAVTQQALWGMQLRGVGTTTGSIETALDYIARGIKVQDDLMECVIDAISVFA